MKNFTRKVLAVGTAFLLGFTAVPVTTVQVQASAVHTITLNGETRPQSETDTVAITVAAPPEPVETPAPAEDLIWLDPQTSVNKTKLFNRLLKQNLAVSDGNPSLEDFVKYLPIDETKVSKEYLFQTAKGYVEDLYNINYQTATAAEVDAIVSKYYTDEIKEILAERDADWEAGYGDRVFDHISFEELQKQQLIMETVFVSDEAFMYRLPPAIDGKSIGSFGFITGNIGPNTSARVRGTMFYRFTSNNNQGKYWNNPGSYVMGEWYWSDVQVDFYEEFGPNGEINTVINAGGLFYFDYENGEVNRSIDGRHINPLSTMPEEPFIDHVLTEAQFRSIMGLDIE